jgi:hypothetical protein
MRVTNRVATEVRSGRKVRKNRIGNRVDLESNSPQLSPAASWTSRDGAEGPHCGSGRPQPNFGSKLTPGAKGESGAWTM